MGTVHFGQVAEVVHKAQHAYGEEADGIEGEERPDDELLGANVFQKTEDAVHAHDEFHQGHPGELLSVVTDALVPAHLGGADKTSLAASDGGKDCLGIADGDTHTEGHEHREGEHANLPAGIAGAALGYEVEEGGRDSSQ